VAVQSSVARVALKEIHVTWLPKMLFTGVISAQFLVALPSTTCWIVFHPFFLRFYIENFVAISD
jgi:hypothetical protein